MRSQAKKKGGRPISWLKKDEEAARSAKVDEGEMESGGKMRKKNKN
jgi:hypothetical protein